MTDAGRPNLTRSVATGAGWLISVSFAGRMIDALGVLILARILQPEDFGLVALATTLFGILSVVTELQVSNALIRLPRLEQHHYATALSFSVARALLVAVGLVIGGGVLSVIYGEPRLLGLCAVMGIGPLAGGLISPRYVQYSRELRFLRISVLEIGAKLVGFAAMVAVALATRSYWAIVTSQIVSMATMSLVIAVMLPYRPSFSLRAWRDILDFSVWTNLTSITSTLSGRLDNFLIAGFLSRTVLGFYVLGDQFASILYSAILQPLQRVLYPGFTQLVDQPARLAAAFVRSQQMLAMAALPVGVGIALVAEPMILLLLGERWRLAAVVVQYVSPVFAFQAMVAPINAIVLALGRQRLLFRRSLLILFVRLPIVIGGLHFFGLYGMLGARILSGGFVVVLFNALLVSQVLGISVPAQLRQVARSLAAVALMTLACVLLQRAIGPTHDPVMLGVTVAATAALGGAVFVAAHAALWALAGFPAGPERDASALLARIGRAGRRRVA